MSSHLLNNSNSTDKLLDTNRLQMSEFNRAMRQINEPDDIRGNEIIDDNKHLKQTINNLNNNVVENYQQFIDTINAGKLIDPTYCERKMATPGALMNMKRRVKRLHLDRQSDLETIQHLMFQYVKKTVKASLFESNIERYTIRLRQKMAVDDEKTAIQRERVALLNRANQIYANDLINRNGILDQVRPKKQLSTISVVSSKTQLLLGEPMIKKEQKPTTMGSFASSGQFKNSAIEIESDDDMADESINRMRVRDRIDDFC